MKGRIKTVCVCPCGEPFIPKYPGQRYIDRLHRYRAQNTRIPVKRSKAPLVGSPDGLGEPQQACYVAVTEGSPSSRAQPSEVPQISPPDAKTLEEFRAIDEVIRREALLTPREVARVLGISVHTLHGWRGKTYRRDLKFVNLAGRRVRYRLRDLQAWLDKLGVGQMAVH